MNASNNTPKPPRQGVGGTSQGSAKGKLSPRPKGTIKM